MTSKLILAIVFSIFSFDQVPADQGRGGGDPHASEFLLYADRFCASVSRYTSRSDAETKCKDSADRIRLSLNQQNKKAEVEFTDKTLLDSNGVVKAAVVEIASRHILVNRKIWTSLAAAEKLAVSAMEISLVSEIPDRYSIGAKILEIELAGTQSPGLMTLQQRTKYSQCTSALTNMAALTNLYTGIGQSCGEIRPKIDDPNYQKLFAKYVKLARAQETIYEVYLNICKHTCEGDVDCGGDLLKACR